MRIAADPLQASERERRAALDVQRQAAAAGIAPQVIEADPGAGITLCEYLPGKAWTAEALADRARLRRRTGPRPRRIPM